MATTGLNKENIATFWATQFCAPLWQIGGREARPVGLCRFYLVNEAVTLARWRRVRRPTARRRSDGRPSSVARLAECRGTDGNLAPLTVFSCPSLFHSFITSHPYTFIAPFLTPFFKNAVLIYQCVLLRLSFIHFLICFNSDSQPLYFHPSASVFAPILPVFANTQFARHLPATAGACFAYEYIQERHNR